MKFDDGDFEGNIPHNYIRDRGNMTPPSSWESDSSEFESQEDLSGSLDSSPSSGEDPSNNVFDLKDQASTKELSNITLQHKSPGVITRNFFSRIVGKKGQKTAQPGQTTTPSPSSAAADESTLLVPVKMQPLTGGPSPPLSSPVPPEVSQPQPAPVAGSASPAAVASDKQGTVAAPAVPSPTIIPPPVQSTLLEGSKQS